MGVGLLNSPMTSRGYADEEMLQVWSVKGTVQAIFDVEAAFSRAQAREGVIPNDAARAIAKAAVCTDEVVEAVESGAMGNPLIASLDTLRAKVPAEARGWVHFGATSQDVMDTARALQIKRSYDIVLDALGELQTHIARLCEEHAGTLMLARTNGQDALPTTLGTRFARWEAALARDAERLRAGRKAAQTAQFSGAAGTYASMGELGSKVARDVAGDLGLEFELVPWHSMRDGITGMCCDLAVLAQTLDKAADDLYQMQSTALGEAHEHVDAHASGSSTMPQKVNPFATMRVDAGARTAIGLACSVLTNAPGQFERDARQLEVERNAVPQVFVAVAKAVRGLDGLLGRLSFDKAAMRRNLDEEGVLLVSEHVMMALAQRLGQERAHDLLQEFAKENREKGIGLEEFLTSQPDCVRAVENLDLQRLEDPTSYLGLSELISHEAARLASNEGHTSRA